MGRGFYFLKSPIYHPARDYLHKLQAQVELLRIAAAPLPAVQDSKTLEAALVNVSDHCFS